MNKWSIYSRLLHWGSACLLVATWVAIRFADNVFLHKSLGLSVLFWTVARLLNRLTIRVNQTRLPLPNSPKWQHLTAKITHVILYGLMLSMPISGMLATMYGGRDVSFFGLFELPSLVTPSRAYSKQFRELHQDMLWSILLVFTNLHILAGLYHQFYKKNDLIRRMI